jgi:hypothetical protein
MLGSKPKPKRDRLGETLRLAASLHVGTSFTCLRSSDPSLQDLNHRQPARMAESKDERESSKTVRCRLSAARSVCPMTRRYFSTEIVSGGCKPTSASFVRSERFSRRTEFVLGTQLGRHSGTPFSPTAIRGRADCHRVRGPQPPPDLLSASVRPWYSRVHYWLDIGNKSDGGQFVLA